MYSTRKSRNNFARRKGPQRMRRNSRRKYTRFTKSEQRLLKRFGESLYKNTAPMSVTNGYFSLASNYFSWNANLTKIAAGTAMGCRGNDDSPILPNCKADMLITQPNGTICNYRLFGITVLSPFVFNNQLPVVDVLSSTLTTGTFMQTPIIFVKDQIIFKFKVWHHEYFTIDTNYGSNSRDVHRIINIPKAAPKYEFTDALGIQFGTGCQLLLLLTDATDSNPNYEMALILNRPFSAIL